MKKWLILLALIPLWYFLFPIYRDRVPAFGCFDDCFNFMGGYFVNSGKHLYSEIFYNHQPIFAYISALIQKIGRPESMYALVWQHRLVVIAWAIGWNILLTFRFGWVGLGFSILYETTKAFLFGERFLAESFIVYPLVYLSGLWWQGSVGRKLVSSVELMVVATLAWFIIFSREPYVPLAAVLFSLIVWQNRRNKFIKVTVVMLLILSAFTILVHNPRDYFFNVITVNRQSVGASEVQQENIVGSGALRMLLYPLVVFSGGNWNLFHQLEAGLAIIFWLASFVLLRLKNKRWLLTNFVILALANIRPVEPGAIYYAAFHHLVGFGVFICITLLILQQSKKVILWGGFAVLAAFAIISSKSYLHDRVDRNVEFTQNYGQYYVPGEVVRLLSQPSDKLFLDGWDDLIYWQAKRLSPYPFSWYTSVMHEFDVYTDARVKMFREKPPDFYYGKCSDDKLESVLPDNVLKDYLRFYWQERPTCLFVHKDMYDRIPKTKLEQVNQQFDYVINFKFQISVR